MHLLRLQQQFRDILFQKRSGVLNGEPQRNLDFLQSDMTVYQNNLYTSLYDNLSHKFKMTKLWMGEEPFFEAAKEYIFTFPQSSPYLCEYGEGFSCVVGDDLGRALSLLEWRMNMALIAYRSDLSLKIEDILSVHPSMMSSIVLRLHSSVHLYESSYPLKDIWMSLQKKEAPLVFQEFSYFFIGADNQESFFFPIDPTEYESLRAIKEGRSLGEVYDLLKGVQHFQQLLNKFMPYFVEIQSKPF